MDEMVGGANETDSSVNNTNKTTGSDSTNGTDFDRPDAVVNNTINNDEKNGTDFW